MSAAVPPSDEAIVRRYTNQPEHMPVELRRQIEDFWGGHPVQLYAVADLDHTMHLVHTWVAIGPDQVALIKGSNGHAAEIVASFPRTHITELREIPGLSCNQLYFMGEPDQPALATVRYTHRQGRAMENIKYVLQQQLKGHEVTLEKPDETYAESMAHAVKEAQASIVTHKLAVLWRLLAYMKPYKTRMILGSVAALLITIVSLLPPYLTGYLIDKVFRPVEDGTIDAHEVSLIAGLIVTAVGVMYALRQFLVWVRLRTMAVLGEFVARDLRTQLYDHLQRLSLSFYSSKQTGSLISRVSSDTDRLWDFIAWGAIDFVISLIMLLGIGGVLISLDWRLGLVMTIPMPVLFYLVFRHGRYMHHIFLRCWRKWSNMTAVLSDTIPGVRVVKACNQEEREKKRFRDRNENMTSTFVEVHATWTTFWPLLWTALHAMMVVVWALAVPRVLGFRTTGPDLSVGVFVSFVMYMGMYIQPIEIINRLTFLTNRATSSAHRVFDILDTQPDITDTTQPVQLTPVQGRVEFNNVSFAYDGVRQVLQNVSFTVEPGEMIGLVGPSGAGKSTVTNLIARFYDIASGSVHIDGVNLQDLDLGHYRKQLGIVMQDPHLFYGTVLDNIRYGLPEATLDEIVDAARAANAHDFICKLPHAYDTVVGERGHTLSGGERQRVSIARAILTNPRILILDEATSSVDTETEYKIQEALERLVQGRTVFAIAHRLSTLRRADRLFVIEEGRLTEMGTHAELLDKPDGTYAKLVKMQQELHSMYVA